jgi:dihydroorotase
MPQALYFCYRTAYTTPLKASVMTLLIKGATIVNEGTTKIADALVQNGRIQRIDTNISYAGAHREINADGLHLMPGVIDDQVHFREPGLTHKAEIRTEAMAAVAGGTTSFMEMPNTVPPALTVALLEEKYARAAEVSVANYSFFMGVSNSNADEVLKTNARKNDICGIKIFMGSSTGDMLVDNFLTIEKIFAGAELLIATHCESEPVVAANKLLYPNPDSAAYHPLLRNAEACYESSLAAVQIAMKYKTRLHILHITTARELSLFTNMLPLEDKRITSEVCVHHLHFTADDYAQYGNLIKCNPAIKSGENKAALWEALLDDRLDVIATDHAPHTWAEKQQPYPQAPAGVPLVQHSLMLMLQYVAEGRITLPKLVEKMCHAPAKCFQIAERGYLREGYHADMVLIDLNKPYTVTKENILHKCGWSPFEGHTFPASIHTTIVSGNVAYENGAVIPTVRGERLRFAR